MVAYTAPSCPLPAAPRARDPFDPAGLEADVSTLAPVGLRSEEQVRVSARASIPPSPLFTESRLLRYVFCLDNLTALLDAALKSEKKFAVEK